jgi:hypothetical protein
MLAAPIILRRAIAARHAPLPTRTGSWGGNRRYGRTPLTFAARRRQSRDLLPGTSLGILKNSVFSSWERYNGRGNRDVFLVDPAEGRQP